MIKITLKDGSVKELAAPQSIADFTKDLSMGLYRNACCALSGECSPCNACDAHLKYYYKQQVKPNISE